MPKSTDIMIPAERIHKSILFIRGHNVILDKDLADLYGVETKVESGCQPQYEPLP